MDKQTVGSGDFHRTIAAPITAPGISAVSVVRVSGPETKSLIAKTLGHAKRILESPRESVYSSFLNRNGETIDSVLAVYFAAPNSFTGEDSLEISFHGSPFILAKALECLYEAGAKPAEAGEFSKQAFLNGKMDLSQTEAIADLIAAESEAQAKVAREQLAGKLSGAISELGEPLRNLLAEIEAYIDFPDEDIEPETHAGWSKRIEAVRASLCQYIDSYQFGRLCREGARVALCGLPNAGKSSLLNKLVGEERAIVTPIAGTTRDFIEERVSIDGLLIKFWDTAGLVDEEAHYTPDEVERLGIERSWERLKESDLALFVFDSTESFSSQVKLFEQVRAAACDTLIVANKVDLIESGTRAKREEELGALPHLFLSAETGNGLAELRSMLSNKFTTKPSGTGSVLVSNERHLRCLIESLRSLDQALGAINEQQAPELISFEIREAASALDDIIGVTHTEDLLGRIFGKFCIGK